MVSLVSPIVACGGGEDAVLARAARDGSGRAAGELFDRHAPVIRRILARTLGPSRDVEDHVQETFLVFFRELPGLRAAAAALRARSGPRC